MTVAFSAPESPYAAELDELLSELATDREGLSSDEAERRLEDVGPNRLPDAEKDHPVIRFLRHFHDPLIYVLLVAAAVTALLGHWVDTAVIMVVVLLNATIGHVQEGQADKALEGLRDMLSARARTRRDGEWQDVDADELVPGDVVRLRAGDRVPADVRVLEANNLAVEEAALTGESEPARKTADAVDDDADLGDRESMAYSSTMVTSGSGTGLVVATGTETEIGRINEMLSGVETLSTPLTRQMNSFGKWLTLVIIVLAIVLFGVGFVFHDYALGELIIASVGFAVAAIPEGLPAIMTITLARGVQLMAKRHAITRRLNAVETLGSVTVICSDKTGTLTKNEMTVQRVVTLDGDYAVEGVGYAPEGTITRADEEIDPCAQHDLRSMAIVAGLANDAEIRERDGEWVLLGEPTDGALRAFALKAELSDDIAERVAELPFDSDNKFMASLDESDAGLRIHLKGAPGPLLERCDRQGPGLARTEELDRDRWEGLIEELSDEGLRVLAAAVREADDGTDSLELGDVDDGGFVFLGLFGILDPPRPEAVEAIEHCREAGIRVVMITGDHAGTAQAIGREMGIDADSVITGAEIEDADDDELRELVCTSDVFARTSPQHKLRIVAALQDRGEVVSMTGDGVNDAPSLKRADVGVAMGMKGTEVTKEAADVVLADDNFVSITDAVKEGRTIYDNLRKSIEFLLPTNGAQGLVIFTAILAGMVLPLTPLQVLWVNMVVSVTLGLALAFEPSEPGVMNRPPRDPKGSLLDPLMLARIGYVSVLIGVATMAVFSLESAGGSPLEVARTTALTTLIVAQAFYLLNVRFIGTRSLRPQLLTTNPVAWISMVVLAGLQLMFVYAPFMREPFDAAPLELRHWLVALAAGAALFAVVEIEKTITRRFAPRR
ncbi:HAD-IC family P-type ATPase [Granulicoccus sp. GXG6511]|uniref:HAD-IC family P-type ATPase n=1 Tax=Granulicoccus sp. GXG6511 TaxID=3381351 RepID=UPI003D7CD401